MGFTKEDMNYAHYKWSSYKKPVMAACSNEPSRRYFDPFDGEQVLYMINYCASIIGNLSLKGAREIENKIAHTLPNEVISERFMFNWLMEQITEEKIR